MKKAKAGGQPGELHILHYGAEVLRKSAARISKVSAALKALAAEMHTLMQRHNGIGLAAPQVGVGKQLAVVNIGEGSTVLVNPRLLHKEGEEVMVEGCLSLPGLYGEVKRAAKVTVAATDLSGKKMKIEAEGMLARVLQHEIDHLQGRLFIDRVDESTLHWLLRPAGSSESEEGMPTEPLTVPTTLQDALRVFTSKPCS
ncbi:MAG: peptide deformylase [Armatimonadetes bacterium]|nr:peptide deformylase [Armatimonadota bacterium]NIM24469.1 peptide deformylase [Armatimonadota bacterium]NIM68340.1 peptide deformylase [Armatimonadota bacterium]NIM76744.1 peptide deformylase [Armatimonadota bacterium]NIN06543.1 peptide deformylase [Armatimonadota bacterium]